MGKLVPALMATGGATAVSVGGVCLARNSGTGTEDATTTTTSTEQHATPPTSTQDLKFESVNAFKAGMKTSDCVKNYFENEISDKADATQISSSVPESTVFFKTPSNDSYKSCLLIQGKVNKYGSGEEEKWNGKFTWLWTFMSEDEGFISFNVAEPSDADSEKMKFEGIFYLLGKESKWEIKHKAETSNKVVDKDNLGSYFPKASNDLKDSVGGEYWGLFDNEEKLKKPCKTGNCGSDNKTDKFISKKLSFAKGTETSKKLVDWSNGINWWTNLYPNIGWSLSNKTDLFTGTWTALSQ